MGPANQQLPQIPGRQCRCCCNSGPRHSFNPFDLSASCWSAVTFHAAVIVILPHTRCVALEDVARSTLRSFNTDRNTTSFQQSPILASAKIVTPATSGPRFSTECTSSLVVDLLSVDAERIDVVSTGHSSTSVPWDAVQVRTLTSSSRRDSRSVGCFEWYNRKKDPGEVDRDPIR